MAEAGGKGKEMAGVVGKGKEQQRDEEGNGAETSDGVKTELRLVGDYEQGDLEVWKGSAERRGGEYQLLRDAPTNLPCLRWWLKTVAEFVVVTGLEVPKHDKVQMMPSASWRGAWKMKALLQFQAVAHATGIMHPPRPRRRGPQQTCGEQRENQHLGSISCREQRPSIAWEASSRGCQTAINREGGRGSIGWGADRRSIRRASAIPWESNGTTTSSSTTGGHKRENHRSSPSVYCRRRWNGKHSEPRGLVPGMQSKVP
ncbi:hypothetical protein KC19_10G066500 [Ceratodon purpureus]|uniref:Uncharacterized protein n=1 Tax=Ceratodon purpureus TaxID=3225 RepID=A0A8T0GK83_CERPU|nr:hypothetical protein KC19_10G066500 [Ceratodon purpureus]